MKSTTSVKDINIHDASFQKHCCEKFGLKLSKCFLVHINNEYIREGQIDPRELFIMKNITTEVEECSKSIQDRVDKMFEIISDSKCPEVTIGSHCSDSYDCPLTECWDGLPEHNIFTLYYGGKKCHDLYCNGVVNIIDIPDSYKLNDKQQIQQACITSGEPHVDREAVMLKPRIPAPKFPEDLGKTWTHYSKSRFGSARFRYNRIGSLLQTHRIS